MPPKKKIELIQAKVLTLSQDSLDKKSVKKTLTKDESDKDESEPTKEKSVKKKIVKEEFVKKKLCKNSTLSGNSTNDNELINLSLNNTKKALLILLEEVRVLELKLEEKNEEVKIIYKNFKELLEKIQTPDNIKSKNNELKVLSDSDNVESD